MDKRKIAESLPGAVAEAVCVMFLATVVAMANAVGLSYILFPELGALASDVLQRPAGKWAKEPWKLVATPTVTGLIGILVGRALPYGLPSVLIILTASIGVIYALRSAVAPAISAGILPLVLGVTSWRYPVCVCGTLLALTLILFAWRAIPFGKRLMPDRTPDRKATERLEVLVKPGWWLVALYAFVIVMAVAVQLTGWRFILFPPLIVIAYEMLGHPDTCPWAREPIKFPIACSLSALIGVAVVLTTGVTALGAAVVAMASLLMLRGGQLRMPPVVAIGVIPFVMAAPTYRYPLSVLIGTSALTLWFLAYCFLAKRLPKNPMLQGS